MPEIGEENRNVSKAKGGGRVGGRLLLPLGGEMVNEIIVIRAADPDGSMFRAIMDVLRDRKAEVIELAAPSLDAFTFGEIAIYPERRTVLKAGEEVRLNHGEFSVLLLLASAPGQVFSKNQLYEAAWHEEYRYGTTMVENIIWRLRQKLEDDPKHPVYIKTVIRSGYKIELPR